MNNKDILQIAMAQSAEDIGCSVSDFTKTESVVTKFKLGKNAKKYYLEPIYANFISYGSNVVAAVQDDLRDIVEEYVKKFEFYHLFESPDMYWLNEKLADKKCAICFMAEYYLPDKDKFYDQKLYEKFYEKLAGKFELRVLEQKDFADLYLPEWSNAICKERKELDVLGAGAYEGDKLVGLAACSADGEEMWQIGVDVLPDYRKNGIASALTSRLAAEIFERGKVPFYCTAWSNIRSVRNAIKCGFIPAWAELSVKSFEVIEEVQNG